MKIDKWSFILLSCLFLLISCGKPNEPESIVPVDTSGGYKIVSKFLTSGNAQDVLKKDSLLYIAQGEGGLIIIDISDPQNPETVSVTTEDARGYSSKIALLDTVVYMAAGTFGITVIDAGNPLAPVVTVSNLGTKPARNVHVFGNFLFTANSEQGVKISDISYSTQPDPRGGVNTIGYAYGLDNSADSSLLFVACGEMGLSIFDISDFQEGFGEYPLAGWCDTPGYAEAVTVLDGDSVAFMACGTAGLQIIDYSDTSNIHIAGSYLPGGYAKELTYYDQRIFLTAEKSGLQVIDVSDITDPKLIGQVETQFALGVDTDGKYIYIADELEGLITVSIPDSLISR
jgi:hypothetical protein